MEAKEEFKLWLWIALLIPACGALALMMAYMQAEGF